MNESLVEIYSGGMANSGARGVKITSNVKDELNYVLYNKGGADDTTADKSIKYKLDVYSGEMNMVSNVSEPTPGIITEDEKPDMTAKTVKPENLPVLTDNTPDSFDGVSNLRFSLTAQPDKVPVKTVELYIKDNTMQDMKNTISCGKRRRVWQKDVLSVDPGKKSYTYYFTVSDGVNKLQQKKRQYMRQTFQRTTSPSILQKISRFQVIHLLSVRRKTEVISSFQLTETT